MKKLALVGLLAVTGIAASANAFNVQCRWVSRVGTVDTVIPATGYNFPVGQTTVNVRLQFGVFDDAQGAAPAGGFIGWNLGTITGSPQPVAGSAAARLTPFNFAPAPGFAGTQSPLALTAIDNTLGTQALVWSGIPGGSDPGSPPPALVRGRNAFISVFSLTLAAGTFDITAAGNSIVASAWNVIQSAPPEVGDDGVFGTPDDVNGGVTYAPATLPPIAFTGCTASFVPAPGAAALLGLGGLVAFRRRRA